MVARDDETGWFATYRSIRKDIVWKNAELFKTWMWALSKASHVDRTAPLNFGNVAAEIKLERGSFITGRKVMGEELNVSGVSAWKRLKKLEKLKKLNI